MNPLPATGITPEELEFLREFTNDEAENRWAPGDVPDDDYRGEAKRAADIASRIVLAEPPTVSEEMAAVKAEALRVQEALNDANFEYDVLAAAIGDLTHVLQQISPNEQSLADAYHKAAGLKRRAETWRKSALTPTK